MSIVLQNFISALKNSYRVGKPVLVFNGYSNMLVSILEIFKKLGFVKDFHVTEENKKKSLLVTLRYSYKSPAIVHIASVSKPSRAFYVSSENLPYSNDNLGYYIVTTNKGIMTDKKARRLGLGGKVLLEVY